MSENGKFGQGGALPLRPAATFFGAPTGDIEGLGSDTVAVAGVYCDHFSAGAPGGRFAARQIRYTSTQAAPSSIDSVIDIGDFNIFPLESARTEAVLAEQCEKVIASRARLLSIGGDYSVSPALLKGISAAHDGSIGLIRVSSRLDLSQQGAADCNGPTRHTTTGRIASIVTGGLSNIAFLGTRGPSTIEEAQYASVSKVISAAELAHDITGSSSGLRDWMSRAERAETFYLSIDADVLAARYGLTALYGTSGGLAKDQLLNVLTALKGMPFVAAELTGHLPNLDIAGRATTSAFAEIAFKLVELLRAGNSSCH